MDRADDRRPSSSPSPSESHRVSAAPPPSPLAPPLDSSVLGRRAFVGLLGWLMGFCLAYIAAAMGLPAPCYLPLEHRWVMAPGQAVSMAFYGQLLWGMGGGILGMAGGIVIGGLAQWSGEFYRLLAAWAALLFLFAFLLHLYQLFG